MTRVYPWPPRQLDATPSQVELVFTSYFLVTGVAMLVTGVVSSRVGHKHTLLTGLAMIVIFRALAGLADGISGIVGFRAGGWATRSSSPLRWPLSSRSPGRERRRR